MAVLAKRRLHGGPRRSKTGIPLRPPTHNMTLRKPIRPNVIVVLAALVWLTAGCNAGGGTSVFLPPGPQTTQPPGNLVLYVAEAIGDRVAAYRMGADGLLPATPFSTLALENPRRLALNGNVLYVATDREVVSLSLGADGSLPATPTAGTQPFNGADIFELAVRGDTLYAGFAGFNRLEAFRLTASGQVPASFLTSSGEFDTDYRTLTVAGGFVYAAARASARIDTYLIGADGSLASTPETQNPSTFITLPDDIVARNGTLYVTNKGRRTLAAFRIRADGLLPQDPDSETQRSGTYQDIVFNGNTIYTCAFNEGRIDSYVLDPADGSLPNAGPDSSTHVDQTTFPTALALRDGVLYVAQACSDRIDAYLITPTGFPTEFPSSSTIAVPDSFPTDIEVYALP